MAEVSPLTDGLVKIHKLITRALSVAVVKCDEYLGKNEVNEEEVKGFEMYLNTLIRVMHAHHVGEDDIIFPHFTGRIEAPYERLKADHVNMAKMLADLENSLEKDKFSDLGRLRNHLDNLQRSWAPHIKAEESSFASAILQKKLTEKEQNELVEKISSHGAKSSGPGPLTLPFVIYNLQGEDRKEFLKDFPWVLKHVLVPLVWRSKWKPMDPFLLN